MGTVNEDHIDALLCFMNGEIEEHGDTPATAFFDFGAGADLSRLQEQSGLSSDEIQRAINTSRARGYIRYAFVNPDSPYRLTAEGQGRAISVAKAKHYVPQPQQPTISIGPINGPTQIGDHNIQTVEAFFQYIVTAIDKSDAPAEQKDEAKGLLQKFLKHPLVCSVVGAGVGGVLGGVLRKQ